MAGEKESELLLPATELHHIFSHETDSEVLNHTVRCVVKGLCNITCVAEAIIDMQPTDSEPNRRMSRRAVIRWLESHYGIENINEARISIGYS